MAASIIALSHKNTINPNMSVDNVEKILKGDDLMLEKYLQVHPEVQKAVAAGQPVVALESTIISHGIPYPKNIEMAKNVSKIIRKMEQYQLL